MGLVATAQGSISKLFKQLVNVIEAGRAHTFPLY